MGELVNPAKQERSRKNQVRILEATEMLLRAQPFEAISVRDIVAAANTSIGAFYSRFRNKEALLPVLVSEQEARLAGKLVRLKKQTANARSMEELADYAISHFVTRYGESPNLSRAVYEYATRRRGASESRRHARQRYDQYSFLIDALLAFKSEITHADPARAVELALYFAIVACRNRLLYPDGPQTRVVGISKSELKTELVRQLCSYLRASS